MFLLLWLLFFFSSDNGKETELHFDGCIWQEWECYSRQNNANYLSMFSLVLLHLNGKIRIISMKDKCKKKKKKVHTAYISPLSGKKPASTSISKIWTEYILVFCCCIYQTGKMCDIGTRPMKISFRSSYNMCIAHCMSERKEKSAKTQRVKYISHTIQNTQQFASTE